MPAARSPAAGRAAGRRGGRALDVQPHRALPRARGGRRGGGRRGGDGARGRPRRTISPPRSTGSATRRRRCTSSVSPPGSTRSFPARARSSGRCGARSRPARPARCSTASSARRCTPGRRVRIETAIGESPASVPSAAAALAQQVFGELDGRRVLLLGAGKISEATARNLVSRGAEIAVVANRTIAHGEDLARKLGARALALDAVAAELEHADVVVSATSAAGLVVSRETVAHALRARKGRPLLLVDLAVPRDLDPAINELEGCFLYDVDDLRGGGRGDALGPPRRGGARGAARRRGGRALPRVARGARRRPDDRVAARARRGDPRQRARAGRRPALGDRSAGTSNPSPPRSWQSSCICRRFG